MVVEFKCSRCGWRNLQTTTCVYGWCKEKERYIKKSIDICNYCGADQTHKVDEGGELCRQT